MPRLRVKFVLSKALSNPSLLLFIQSLFYRVNIFSRRFVAMFMNLLSLQFEQILIYMLLYLIACKYS